MRFKATRTFYGIIKATFQHLKMNKKENSSILNIALTIFSIILIILGLVFIYLGIKDILNNGNNGQTTSIIQTDNTGGNINIGISVTKSPEEITASTKLTAQEKSMQTQKVIQATGKWVATDYVKGDITTGEYIVKQGDTLWEIAEAVYGDGYQWTKILERNKLSIRKLPNNFFRALLQPQ